MYIYYGNASAPNVFDPNKVFLFFDHFQNMSKWTIGDGASATVSNSVVSITDPDMYGGELATPTSFGPGNVSARIYAKTSGIQDAAQLGFNGPVRCLVTQLTYLDETKVIGMGYDGNTETDTTSYSLDRTQWHTYTTEWVNSNTARFSVDGANQKTITSSIPTTSLPIWLWTYYGTGHPNSRLDVDWVEVYKTTVNPLTHGAWTSEQQTGGSPPPANSPPLSGYSYYKSITINTQTALTDYQLFFNVYNTAGTDSGYTVYTGGNALHWPYDIRFTDANNNVYPCTILASNASCAQYAVKVPLLNPGDNTVNIDYGNSSASDPSNPSGTFIWYDSLDNLNNWTTYGSPTSNLSGGAVSVRASTGTFGAYLSSQSYGPYGVGTVIRAKASTTDASAPFGLSDTGGNSVVNFFSGGWTGIYGLSSTSWSETDANPYNNPDKTNYHVYRSEWASPSLCRYYLDNTQETETYSHIPTTPLKAYIGVTSASTVATYDYIGIYNTSPTMVTATVTVTSPPSGAPVAGFNVSNNIGYAPLTLQFTDTSSGSPTGWQWNFGDGTANSTLQSPSHTYGSAGMYNVKMTASNANGSNTTSDINICVLIPPPVARLHLQCH